MPTYTVMVQKRFGEKKEQKGYPILVLNIEITSDRPDKPAGRWSVTEATKKLIKVSSGQCLWTSYGLGLFNGTVDRKTVDLTNGQVLKDVPDGVTDRPYDEAYQPGIQLAAFGAKPQPVATKDRTVLLATKWDAKAGLTGDTLVWWTDELKQKEAKSK